MIILLGLAGSGKSTQGQILADKYGWKWISVGQVLRDEGGFEEILKSGELVDDQVVIDLMNREIGKVEEKGIETIVDGYPRDEYQAKWIADNIPEKVDAVIYLEVPKEELWDRIKKRGRSDDTKEAIERRFAIVEQNIYSIINLLKAKNVKITTVDGVGSFEEVTARLAAEIEKTLPNIAIKK